jgi:hypothetical protein
MKNIEFNGVWWLPHKPKVAVGGTLTFSQQNGGKLELLGTLKSAFEGGPKDHPIILGNTVCGKRITLQGCDETSMVISLMESRDYRVRFIFVGDHIPNEESLRFHKLQARFTYFYDWVGITGVKRESLGDGQKFQFTYETPEDISISVPDGTLDITFGANLKSAYDFSHIKENSSIYIEFDRDMEFYTFHRAYLFPLLALISLGTTKPIFVEELFLFLRDSPNNYLTVYYSQHFYHAKKKEQLFRPDMLFTLTDIYDGFEAKINTWLALCYKIDNVFHLLRRIRISPELFQELRFLSLAQAIETFHRLMRVNEVVPQKEHEERVANILMGLSESDEVWVREILEHTNEPRLAHRLKNLLVENKTVMNALIQNPQDTNSKRNKFIRSVTATRNYYTHFDKQGEGEALRGAPLHYVTEKLSILLEACLLGELGIPPDRQSDLFGQNDRYNRLTSK